MLSAEALASEVRRPAFVIPAALEAKQPAEERGSGRDDVRLLVTKAGSRDVHASFRQLPDLLDAGDLIVLNQSATIPAALTARRADESNVRLHLSTRLPADLTVIEVRDAQVEPHERLRLAAGGMAEILTPYRDSRRLWVARLYLPAPFLSYVSRFGEPIRYRHASGDWPLETYQNVYASEPGSAEMPSAGRPFTQAALQRLRDRNVDIAFVTLHAGVSSPERDEPPYEEWYSVPSETAHAIQRVRRNHGRVIAVGTTVVRALESSLDEHGRIIASRGWSDLVITPQLGVSAVDGIVTGFHEPTSSHLAMLEAIAGPDSVAHAYATALKAGYLWHEFGDSHLILSGT
jgi:S-adenosylmethionine:tRNA ribosyltransferase-isomerase